MNTQKIHEGTKELKIFFENKNFKISEVRETLFRMIDYVDEHYDEDSRDSPFKTNCLGNKFNELLTA